MPPSKKKQRVDKRRVLDPPAEFKVESLLQFRRRIEMCRDPTTGQKTLQRVHPEYLVRWEGYGNKYDLWVNKKDISKDCIDEFEGVSLENATQRLATVPVAKHPSFPGCGMSMRMSSFIKQKVMLKDGIHYPKKKATRNSVIVKTLQKETVLNQGKLTNQDRIQTSSTSVKKGVVCNSFKSGNQPTKESLTFFNQGEDSNMNKLGLKQTVVIQGEVPSSLTPGNISTQEPKSTKTSNTRKFDSVTVAALDSFVLSLDKIIFTSQDFTDTKEGSRIFAQQQAAKLYQELLSTKQQQLQPFLDLIRHSAHNLNDKHIIKIITDKDENPTGWTCVVCRTKHKSTRKDKVLDHVLSKGHWLCVDARSLRCQDKSVKNVTINQARLQYFPKLIQQGSVIAIAQTSLPFTAGSIALKLIQKSISSINGGREIPQHEINEARRLGLTVLAEAGDRLNVVHKPINKNQFGIRHPLPLHRTQVSRNIASIGEEIVGLKIKFFQQSNHVSIFVDESTTTAMQSRPVYCGAIGITKEFDWIMCFVGQTNTAGCESGQVYFNAVKSVYDPYKIWEIKKSVGTDGCSAMRSTTHYAGVDANGNHGESFIAYVNRDGIKPNVLAFHSVLHIISLAVGDCVKELPAFWIKHVRLLYTYFARSAKRKDHLRQCYKKTMEGLNNLVDQFGNLYETHGWKLTHTKMYCPSRWTGVHTSCKSAIGAWPGLVSLKNDLLLSGHGGYGGNQLDQQIEDDQVSSGSENDSINDTGNNEDWYGLFNSDNTNTGEKNVSKNKVDSLLERERGITDCNWGLNSMMIGMLDPVTLCMARLQTTQQPIQHRVARQILKMIRDIERSFVSKPNETPEFPPVYSQWRDTMCIPVIDKQELVRRIDNISKNVAMNLLKSLDSRLKPYMSYYHAMELIDPTAPGTRPSNGTWAAVRSICVQYCLDYDNVRKEILEMRDDSIELSVMDIELCKKNLLCYYKTNCQIQPILQRKKYLESYANVIFQLPFETVLIESLFSIMNYNKDKKRASLNDATVAGVLHTRDIPPTLDHSLNAFNEESLKLNIEKCHNHQLSW